MASTVVGRLKEILSSIFHPEPGGEKGAGGVKTVSPVKLSRPFTLDDTCNRDDPMFKKMMEEDLSGMDTPLKLMKRYADILNEKTSHGEIDEKLDRLFLCGKTPQTLDGYYHGITISLKTGTDIYSIFDDIRKKLNIKEEFDPIQVFYGRLISKTSPWAGKNFKKLAYKKLSELTGNFYKEGDTAYLGINSFRKENKGFVNNLSGQVLSAVMEMEGVPGPEKKQQSWIYAKGGLFVASRRESVDAAHSGKEVMALNYRWKELGNVFPNKLLVDEIVQIADGLYLGKLYYATALQYISPDYDPAVSNEDYKYRNFGYFLLMDDTWLHEKNMLFPDLTYELADDLPQKFSTFHFTESAEGRAIQESLGEGKTILHHLQALSKGVKEGTESEEKYFSEMHKLFMCGQRPDGIQGFFHGGVVAFKSSGFLKKLETNILNDIWPKVRPFSPWTGKTYTNTTVEEIKKYIGSDAGYYEGKEPIILGTNTYRKDLDITLPATTFIEHLDKTGMVVEYPSDEEKSKDIYVKSFYFIANYEKSINPENKGREVLQFNYRWPEFHTMAPDHLCIDELIRIADGLYLGQLLYSTAPEIKYDPQQDPSVYKYELFGYFMLLDDEWQAIKEFIRFDTD